MALSWLFGFIAIIAVSFYFYFKHFYTYWARKGVAQLKPVFPFGDGSELGKTIHISKAIVKFYNEFKSKGKLGGIYLGFRPVAFLTDLDLIKAVTIKDFDNFCNKGQYHNEKDDPLTGHLLNLEDDKWRRMRQKLTPTFTSGKIKTMFGTVSEVSNRLVNKINEDIKDNEQIDLKDMMGKFTTDVIGTVAFGIECNSLTDPDSEFYKMGLKTLNNQHILKRVLLNSFPDLARKLHVKLIPQFISDFYLSVVQNTINYREKNSTQRNDFMNLMIQMKNSAGKDNLTLNEITAQSFVFFLAGYETTATTLTYCIYELSRELDIQTRVRSEMNNVLEKHNGEITYEAISEMKYLDQVLNETLRKYPPAPIVNRISTAEYKIPGTSIVLDPKTSIMIPIYAIHHDPEIYREPNLFNPDRFAPEEVAKRHPLSFIPFGEGPRTCIGMRFALVEAKLALVKMLTQFEFKSVEEMKFSITKVLLQPDGPVLVKVEKL